MKSNASPVHSVAALTAAGSVAQPVAALPRAARLSAWCDLAPLCLWLLGCFAPAQAHDLQHGLRPWPPASASGTTQ
jgi:hypothetical protein